MYRLFLTRVMKGTSGLDLRGKTLIVTGASRGIGRALASELAQNGESKVTYSQIERDNTMANLEGSTYLCRLKYVFAL